MHRILIVGSAKDGKYIGVLIKECHKVSGDISFDLFNTNGSIPESKCPFREHLGKFYTIRRHYPSFLYGIPGLRGWVRNLDIKISVKEAIKAMKTAGIHYAAVNFQSLSPVYADAVDDLKQVSSAIIATPWGSDVLRASNKNLDKLHNLMEKADVITAPSGTRFTEDVVRLTRCDCAKLYDASLGSRTIDVQSQLDNVCREEAKSKFGLESRFVITCGYTASAAQHHYKIIEQIKKVKDKLPANYILVFPLTYGDMEYGKRLAADLRNTGLEYKVFDSFMTSEEVAYLRKAADVFIHAQVSDANCGAISEHLMAKCRVVNCGWITYPHHEIYGSPFYTFNMFDELPSALLEACNDNSCRVSDKLVADIKNRGWNNLAKVWANLYESYE